MKRKWTYPSISFPVYNHFSLYLHLPLALSDSNLNFLYSKLEWICEVSINIFVVHTLFVWFGFLHSVQLSFYNVKSSFFYWWVLLFYCMSITLVVLILLLMRHLISPVNLFQMLLNTCIWLCVEYTFLSCRCSILGVEQLVILERNMINF